MEHVLHVSQAQARPNIMRSITEISNQLARSVGSVEAFTLSITFNHVVNSLQGIEFRRVLSRSSTLDSIIISAINTLLIQSNEINVIVTSNEHQSGLSKSVQREFQVNQKSVNYISPTQRITTTPS